MLTSRFSTWTFVVFLLLSLMLVVHLLFGFITPVVMAMVIVSIFSPLHVRLLQLLNHRDYLTAGISTVLVFLCVLIPLTLFLVALIQQGLVLFQATQQLTTSADLSGVMSSLRSVLETINGHLKPYGINISPERILNVAASFLQSFGRRLYEGIGLIAGNLMSLAMNFILTIALVFIFFVSGKAAKNFVMDLVPLPQNEKERLATRFYELSLAVFVGNGLISMVEGLLGGLSCYFFSIQGALIWGVMMTITAFLPVVGASIVVIPATIYLLLVDKTWQAVVFLTFNGLQLALLETLVKPRLIGTKSQMHAALVFMSVLGGIQVYGAFGLFYGPLLMTVFLALAEIYKEHYRKRLLRAPTQS